MVLNIKYLKQKHLKLTTIMNIKAKTLENNYNNEY